MIDGVSVEQLVVQILNLWLESLLEGKGWGGSGSSLPLVCVDACSIAYPVANQWSSISCLVVKAKR